jgi:hypothetical protein
MSVIEVVPATMAHARAIRLRPGDRREIEALGETPESAFTKTLARSLWAETYLIDGEPAVMRGVIPLCLLGGIANAWLLSGEPVERHRKSFLELTRRGVERLRGEHRLLLSWVHADYARAIRWLRWLGFDLEPARPLGPLGAPFHKATLKGHA